VPARNVRPSCAQCAPPSARRPDRYASREDLTILEDGFPQSVDVFQEAVLPVTFMLALDRAAA
jgi:hypothetical protein